MAKNKFRRPKFVDHVIVDKKERVVGHLRVKPSGVGWARTDGKKWRSVSLARFIRFMEEHGRKRTK